VEFTPLIVPAIKKLPWLIAPFDGAPLIATATMDKLSYVQGNAAKELAGKFVHQFFTDTRRTDRNQGKTKGFVLVTHMAEFDLHVLFKAFEIAL
jgi:hypothetical protein